jgi:hypothetical protein
MSQIRSCQIHKLVDPYPIIGYSWEKAYSKWWFVQINNIQQYAPFIEVSSNLETPWQYSMDERFWWFWPIMTMILPGVVAPFQEVLVLLRLIWTSCVWAEAGNILWIYGTVCGSISGIGVRCPRPRVDDGWLRGRMMEPASWLHCYRVILYIYCIYIYMYLFNLFIQITVQYVYIYTHIYIHIYIYIN